MLPQEHKRSLLTATHGPDGAYEIRGPLGTALGLLLFFAGVIFGYMLLTGKIETYESDRVCVTKGDISADMRLRKEGYRRDGLSFQGNRELQCYRPPASKQDKAADAKNSTLPE